MTSYYPSHFVEFETLPLPYDDYDDYFHDDDNGDNDEDDYDDNCDDDGDKIIIKIMGIFSTG